MRSLNFFRPAEAGILVANDLVFVVLPRVTVVAPMPKKAVSISVNVIGVLSGMVLPEVHTSVTVPVTHVFVMTMAANKNTT